MDFIEFLGKLVLPLICMVVSVFLTVMFVSLFQFLFPNTYNIAMKTTSFRPSLAFWLLALACFNLFVWLFLEFLKSVLPVMG